eukprot:2383258-Amphidinium_carterae.1
MDWTFPSLSSIRRLWDTLPNYSNHVGKAILPAPCSFVCSTYVPQCKSNIQVFTSKISGVLAIM